MTQAPKKVLIVTYYWPPSGGSGVQRWLKFVKYLPGFGWKPYIVTPSNPSFSIRDLSLLKEVPEEAEVHKLPIWEPYEIFLKFSSLFGKKKSAKPTDLVATRNASVIQRLGTWVRANFFVPDPRIYWVRPTVAFLKDFLRRNDIHTIITTGPPHSLHLIGLQIKRQMPDVRWIADFRDPWSEWGLLESLKVGKSAMKKHRQMERSVLMIADEIVTITPFYVRRFEKLSGRKVNLLTNGFDEQDFRNLAITRSPKFTIRHVGIINEKVDPKPLVAALESLLVENPEVRNNVSIEFIGEVHAQFRSQVSSSPGLAPLFNFSGNIAHDELVKTYGSSSLLLLILTGYKDAAGYMPGKLFEYIATGLPVLGIGPEEGDAARLLRETESGVMLGADKTEAIKSAILELYNRWKRWERYSPAAQQEHPYSRRSVTKRLVKLLDQEMP